MTELCENQAVDYLLCIYVCVYICMRLTKCGQICAWERTQEYENEQAGRYSLLLGPWVSGPEQTAETPTFWSIISSLTLEFTKNLLWSSVLTGFSKAVGS